MYEFNRTGQKFGALRVICKDRITAETIWWMCKCKCGEKRNVEERRLVKGLITTCLKCEVKKKEAKRF